MGVKHILRGFVLDQLGHREDRAYWRQSGRDVALPVGARVLLWQPDGKLGDAIVNTTLVESLAGQRPDVKVAIACPAGLVSYWERIPGVAKVVAHTRPRETAAALGVSARVDLFISLETFVSIETLAFIRLVQPATTMGFSVRQVRAFDFSIVDHTYEHPRRHISERLRNICALLKIDYRPGASIARVAPSACTQRVRMPVDGQTVFVNVHGASARRVFSDDTLEWLLACIRREAPEAQVILNVPADRRGHFVRRFTMPNPSQVWLAPPDMAVWELLALVQQCQAVVTPDTALGHIAAAVDVPVAVFYADAHYNPVVWKPMSERLHMVIPHGDGTVNDFDRHSAAVSVQALLAHCALALIRQRA